MTSFLNAQHIRIVDYPHFAEPLRDRIRANAEKLAESGGAKIGQLAKAPIRKEDVVAAVIKTRGDHPGLVYILFDPELGPIDLREILRGCNRRYLEFLPTSPPAIARRVN